jgi:3-methyladenine DNA glycosylase AlkD
LGAAKTDNFTTMKIRKGQLRRLAKPKPQANSNATKQWAESFTDYLRSECHLAENTVVAYSRDMTKFLAWVGDRKIAKLTINELSDFVGHLSAQLDFAARDFRQNVFPLSPVGRRDRRQHCRTARQPKDLATCAAGFVQQRD